MDFIVAQTIDSERNFREREGGREGEREMEGGKEGEGEGGREGGRWRDVLPEASIYQSHTA